MEKETLTIAHATDFYPGAHKIWGGAEQAALRVAMLLKNEKNVREFFITLPADGKIEDFPAYQIPRSEEKFPAGKKFFSFLKFHFPLDPVIEGEARRILRKEKPDLLHLHKFDLLSFSMITAAGKERIPVIFSLYDLWALCPGRILMDEKDEICTRFHGPYCARCTSTPGLAHVIGKRLRRPFFAHFLKQVERFVVLSGTVRKSLISLGYPAERIDILPLPLLIDEKEVARQQGEPDSLLFAGWVNPHKGLLVLIEALGLVKKSIPGVRLLVAETGADPSYRKKILARIEELGLKDNVTMLGKKSNEEVRGYLSKARGVVVPEQWGIAWPIFLTEAMYYGKPVVASDIGDISSFIRDGESGYLADYKSPAHFAEKITKMLRDPDGSEAMAKRAMQDIAALTDENSIREQLMGIYRKARGRG